MEQLRNQNINQFIFYQGEIKVGETTFPFHCRGKKQQQPSAKLFLAAAIACFGIFLLVPTCVHAQGFHRETALLKKYSTLKDLVVDIKNGKVDFKDFRDSDGIALAVMKNSEIYDNADSNMQECIDFAGKVGHNLGDREIVHCFEDSNYFKNKYHLNSSRTAEPAASTAANNAAKKKQTGTGSSSHSIMSMSDYVEQNKFIDELVKTGKFTEKEATQFAIKIYQSDIQMKSPKLSDSATTPSHGTSEDSNGMDDSKNNVDNSGGHKNLSQLVRDIKSGDTDLDKISLNDFQNSEAYTEADSQTQDCINFAGKVGHNLGDYEIVHCYENPNYFKNKQQSKSTVSSSTASSTGSTVAGTIGDNKAASDHDDKKPTPR